MADYKYRVEYEKHGEFSWRESGENSYNSRFDIEEARKEAARLNQKYNGTEGRSKMTYRVVEIASGKDVTAEGDKGEQMATEAENIKAKLLKMAGASQTPAKATVTHQAETYPNGYPQY